MAPPLYRLRWKRENARSESINRHRMTNLLARSYSEVGLFRHLYHIDGKNCPSYKLANEVVEERHPTGTYGYVSALFKQGKGVSSIDFDKKGKYLASVTRDGCLSIHDFEVLYSDALSFTADIVGQVLVDDGKKPKLHSVVGEQLVAVKWSHVNENQVVYASNLFGGVHVYDVDALTEPSLYSARVTRHHRQGVSDIALESHGPRIFACGLNGLVTAWDPRVGIEPCLEIQSKGSLKSIQLDVQNKFILAAGNLGHVYIWDVRGGRNYPVNDDLHQPFKTARLIELLDQMVTDSEVKRKKGICSIRLNPSCRYQLSFYLNDGRTGILDTKNFQVTHYHRLPHQESWEYVYGYANPSWLSTYSIYLAPFIKSIRLLDFYPSQNSPLHVDYRGVDQYNKYEDISCSQQIMSCAAHPSYTAIVAGTKKNSLLLISQKRTSYKGEEVPKEGEKVQTDPSTVVAT